MDKKALLLFSILIILLSIPKVGSANSQRISAWIVGDGLSCMIYYPDEVKINEEFQVTFRIVPQVDLYLLSYGTKIYVEVSGTIGPNGEWAIWNHTWRDMVMSSESYYEISQTFIIHSLPNLLDCGYVAAKVTAIYDAMGERHSLSIVLPVLTKIYYKTYQELKEDYNSLNQSYQDLQENLESEIKSLKANLDLFRNLTVVLIITTIVLATVTVHFAIRTRRMGLGNKPKPKTEA